MMSAGILADNQTMFNEALNYFYNGAGNGAIKKTVWVLYDDGTLRVIWPGEFTILSYSNREVNIGPLKDRSP